MSTPLSYCAKLSLLSLTCSFLLLAVIPPQASAKVWFEEYGIASKQELTSPASVPGLIRALEDRDKGVRKLAAGCLAKIGPAAKNAVPALLRNLDDKDANARKAALAAIERIGYRGDDYSAALIKMAAEDPHPKLRVYAEKLRLKHGGKAASGSVASAQAKGGSGTADYNLPQAAQENRYGVAVIIGNRNYQSNNRDVPNVDFAHNDADAVYQYVTQTLGFREGNVILLKDATQADMVSTFGTAGNPKGKLYDWVKPNQSDVFVFYSGHGAPSVNNGQGYLLPVDGNPMKVELNGFPLDTLYSNLAKIPAHSTTIILDACFSGASATGSVVRSASSISLKLVESNAHIPKATVLTAAGLSEVASWDESAKQGLFTSHFLKGISGDADEDGFGNGDGRITLGELKKYLQEEVTYNARRLYGRDQNPQITGNPNQILLGE